jgi:23S rRNA pseudouridine1911/1915/1917 synthase
MPTPQQLTVDRSIEEGERIDRYLARKLKKSYSRTVLKKMIEEGLVTVEGRRVAAHYAVKTGEKISVEPPVVKESTTPAQDIPLNILYEDNDLLLLNKPPGMVVHPAPGNADQTLVNALLYHVKKLSQVGGPIRPGIVHRLDKDTSGIMMVAKNDRAHAALAAQFKDQNVDRIYKVLVGGVVQHDEGVCEEPVGRAFLNRRKVMVKPSGGKEALTYFKVLERFEDATFLELHLHTGRTHQIRVHMRHLGHPVLGDAFYGVKSPWINRQCVHAFALGFIHPRTQKKMVFECPLPEDIQSVLSKLRQS